MYWKALLTALILTVPLTVDSSNPNAGSCASETGAAYGLCIAASHLECGTVDEKNTKACTKIEENYSQITGEEPPWLFECPCFNYAEAEAMILREDNYLFCHVMNWSYLDIYSISISEDPGTWIPAIASVGASAFPDHGYCGYRQQVPLIDRHDMYEYLNNEVPPELGACLDIMQTVTTTHGSGICHEPHGGI